LQRKLLNFSVKTKILVATIDPIPAAA